MDERPSTFGRLLRERAAQLAMTNKAGHGDADKLATYLSDRGIRCTTRTVESYFNGERVPGIGKLELILDALDLYGDDRLRAYELAGQARRGGDPDTIEADTTSAA